MQAYDIVFESGGGWCYTEKGSGPVEVRVAEAGWMGTDGPALGNAWPRGPRTGLPMAHVLTLRLPEEYRTRGADLVAVSFFQGEGQFAEEDDAADPDDPFVIARAEATVHPQTMLLTDIIDGRFALVWLTAEEFEAGPAAPPEDVRRDGWPDNDDGGPNAWDDPTDFRRLGLALRDDPNAGKAPGAADWVRPQGPLGYDLPPWAKALWGRCHLGGTCFPVQAMPSGLTAAYFELEEIGPMNLGGGGALQCDLASGAFDWACG